jgi:hypothetical protein
VGPVRNRLTSLAARSRPSRTHISPSSFQLRQLLAQTQAQAGRNFGSLFFRVVAVVGHHLLPAQAVTEDTVRMALAVVAVAAVRLQVASAVTVVRAS